MKSGNKFSLKTIFWVACFAFIALLGLHFFFEDKIYPGVQVAGVSLSGKTQSQAQDKLSKIPIPHLSLVSENPKIQANLENISVEYDWAKSAENAYNVGRQNSLKTRLKERTTVMIRGKNLPLVTKIDQEGLDNLIENIKDEVGVPATEPTLSIEQGKVVVNKGKDGVELDENKLKDEIAKDIYFAKQETITLPLFFTKSHLEDSEAETIRLRAEKLLGKSLKFSVEYQNFIYKDSDLLPLLAPEGFKEDKIDTLVEDIAKNTDRPPQDARLVFEEGKVKEFAPGKDGLKTDKKELKNRIKAGIENLIVGDQKQVAAEIPVEHTKPEVATGEVNNLGIKELIGRGTSKFHGSIPGRIHNVALAASRMNGLLIKPGDTFSFNTALGDVSAYTGYQQAYVIKDGKTVLGDGGGVCQVSTTLFRAALNTGLPIAERHAHAYRVHYYEEDTKPGIDATVYSPTVDLKFTNDTPANILIQATADTKNMTLTFELYGTSDGRVAQILNHRVWDVVPAPPPLYQDDPTLAPGVIKQVDFAAPGTKAAFDYKVTRAGEVLQNRTFYSNFRPWQAVFLVGPGGVPTDQAQ